MDLFSKKKKERKTKEKKKRVEWYRVEGIPENLIKKLDLPGLSFREGMKFFYFQAKSEEELEKAKEEIGKYIDLENVKIEEYS